MEIQSFKVKVVKHSGLESTIVGGAIHTPVL